MKVISPSKLKMLILVIAACGVLVAVHRFGSMRSTPRTEQSPEHVLNSYDLGKQALSPKKTVRVSFKGVDPAGKCGFRSRYDDTTGVLDSRGASMRNDTPILEFRFIKRQEGHKVQRFTLYPFREGQNLRTFECENLAFRRKDGINACRVCVVDEKLRDEPGVYGVIAGRSYRVNAWPLGTSKMSMRQQVAQTLLEVPKDLEPGTITVYEIDLDIRLDLKQKWKKRYPILLRVNDDPKEGLNISLSDPARGEPDDAPVLFKRVFPGQYSCSVRELGGQLVAIDNRTRYAECARYYVASVKKASLVLPRDADVTLEERDLVKWKCQVPTDLPPDAHIIWMLVNPNDRVPVAWSKPGNKLSGAVSMSCPPGKYYIAYGSSNTPVAFGIVDVKKADSGKTLNVERIKK